MVENGLEVGGQNRGQYLAELWGFSLAFQFGLAQLLLGRGASVWSYQESINSLVSFCFLLLLTSSARYSYVTLTTTAGFGARGYHCSVTMNGQLLVIAGYNGSNWNDVWRSSDGVSWAQLTSAASFAARQGHGCVVLGSQALVIGGYSGSAYKSDVWASPSGASWSSVGSGGFSARAYFGAVVFLGKLWVIAGYNGSADLSDVWSSVSGATGTWSQALTSSPMFGARDNLPLIVFNSQMWLAGGYRTGFTMLKDVCLSTCSLFVAGFVDEA